jgi:hypothetical protein
LLVGRGQLVSTQGGQGVIRLHELAELREACCCAAAEQQLTTTNCGRADGQMSSSTNVQLALITRACRSEIGWFPLDRSVGQNVPEIREGVSPAAQAEFPHRPPKGQPGLDPPTTSPRQRPGSVPDHPLTATCRARSPREAGGMCCVRQRNETSHQLRLSLCG